MKRFCWLLTVCAIIVIGVGFYRGWFTLSGGRTAENNNIGVELTVDTDKLKQDTGIQKDDTKATDQQPLE